MGTHKIQFLLKKNQAYGHWSKRRSSGLWHSISHVAEALKQRGFKVDVVECHDNNSIDKEVHRFKPDIAIVEALWVVPEKFHILKKLHPKVKWFVRIHSDIPFLAMEGSAIEWLSQYPKRGVGVIANSRSAYKALQNIVDLDHLYYLPNIYLSKGWDIRANQKRSFIDVGCFGAIRPLKNQLIQALAAIQFAKEKNKFLFFHINGTRVEQKGDSVLKNLRKLFHEESDSACLIEHEWRSPETFIHNLKQFDIGMQVSLTETFNIVCADYVTAGLPVVASKEIKWLSPMSFARATSVSSIVKAMHRAYGSRIQVILNKFRLKRSARLATLKWLKFLKKEL